ncbi:MAG: insulinase family protein [Ruminococcaceae bacterium]|nr:insulinase family protein [Oscillospiraceae bacterium]
MEPIVQKPLDGVTFLTITDDRFTTARISVSLYVPLAEQTAGLYATLPFLLSRGCRRFDSVTAFHRELDRLYGATVNGSLDVSGETQILQLYMSCLDDRFALKGEAVSAECAELLLDVLFDPPLENGVFRAQDVEEERRCTLESIAAEINNKRRYAANRGKEVLCKGEPYAVSRFGTKERVEALTPEELTAAWRELLRTAPMRVVYQGSGDGKAVLDAFVNRLGERRANTMPAVVQNPAKAEIARENEQMDVNQCQLVLGFRTEVSGDHPLCDALRVANAVFGATPHSLLFRHVREEHSLCYYCVSRYDRRKGIVLVESGVEEASLVKAEEEILRQLEDLKNGKFTDEELENARLSQLDALMGIQDSSGMIEEWYSSQGPDRLRSPEQVMDGIRAVTREQVIEAAKTIAHDCVFTLTPDRKEETA